MKLTLRTLLAWLDDTLPPAEVREIGKQVTESPFAKELVERIHRVTRQRRLTIPTWSTGPDATDPNLVASYLDNELEPDQVAEFERKCLTSDVHLAEVASVHQVLSLVGQKAKVPNEARLRMYGLIKGRESTRPKPSAHDREPEPAQAAEPIQPWVPPRPPERPWVDRYGPTAAVVALILALVFFAWQTLRPSEEPVRYRLPQALLGTAAAPAPTKAAAAQPAPGAVATAPQPATAPVAAAGAPGESGTTKPGDQASAAAKAEEPKEAAGKEATAAKTAEGPAPGSAGLARKPEGLLLRYHPERRDWQRITDATPLNEQDRLLSLAPFRATLELGQAPIDLVGETEVWVRTTPKTQSARFTLAQGRAVLHGTTPPLPFEVQCGAQTVTLTPPSGSTIGVERVNRRAPGEAAPSGPMLVVYAPDGPLTVSASGGEESLKGAGAVTVGPDGKATASTAQVIPAWVGETAPPPFDQKVGEQFLTFFRPDRPIMTSLVEASEDDKKDVCRLAISALKAVGDISFVVPVLKRKGGVTAATARRTAIAVLRSYLAESPDAVKTLRQQLRNEMGAEQAAATEKLLVGYTPKEAADEATYSKLVQLLGTTDDSEVGLRELALDNLEQLTGRDDLGYDPENPSASSGKGLRAWKDLLRDHDLKPATARAETR